MHMLDVYQPFGPGFNTITLLYITSDIELSNIQQLLTNLINHLGMHSFNETQFDKFCQQSINELIYNWCCALLTTKTILYYPQSTISLKGLVKIAF